MKFLEDFKILFKNYNFEMLDIEKYKELIIKIVLVKGNWEYIEKFFIFYSFNEIKEVFLKDFYGV